MRIWRHEGDGGFLRSEYHLVVIRPFSDGHQGIGETRTQAGDVCVRLAKVKVVGVGGLNRSKRVRELSTLSAYAVFVHCAPPVQAR